MKLEHVALNVPEPAKIARWYAEHLQMEIVRADTESPYIHFLADSARQSMIEFYHMPEVEVPEYATMDPLIVHLAFAVEDIEAARERLLAAGATQATEMRVTPAGDKLLFLRDPWGVALQILTRTKPLI